MRTLRHPKSAVLTIIILIMVPWLLQEHAWGLALAQPSAPGAVVAEPGVLASPVTLTSVADAMIAENHPAVNVGNAEDMWAGYDDNPDTNAGIVRSLARFDLSSLPPGATVVSATLRLYLVAHWDFPNRTRTYTTYRVASAWDESTVTWQSAPAAGESYGQAGVTAGAWGWYAFDVTDLVKAWESGTYANHGILIRGDESSSADSGYRAFSTREGPYPPQLVIHYGGGPG